jgi:hypothetical protein
MAAAEVTSLDNPLALQLLLPLVVEQPSLYEHNVLLEEQLPQLLLPLVVEQHVLLEEQLPQLLLPLVVEQPLLYTNRSACTCWC